MADTEKRVLADVPEDFFWDMKKRLADLKINQKTMLAVAIRQFIGSDFPLELLITDSEELAKIRAMGIN